eukprot:TRINITY_DN10350_c0_g2_i1.p1 TRINITY_DN10350_c0_g2~~TRINITY_DN10350_c0_g2_i1.p1  ORF type:complete len:179 (+),score=34.25 TRINITY_DN10350_c0_g2_i1:160-696(+)
MCIRDRYQRRVRGCIEPTTMDATPALLVGTWEWVFHDHDEDITQIYTLAGDGSATYSHYALSDPGMDNDTWEKQGHWAIEPEGTVSVTFATGRYRDAQEHAMGNTGWVDRSAEVAGQCLQLCVVDGKMQELSRKQYCGPKWFAKTEAIQPTPPLGPRRLGGSACETSRRYCSLTNQRD